MTNKKLKCRGVELNIAFYLSEDEAVKVNKKTFFSAIGCLDIHPRPIGNYINVGSSGGYVTIWRQNGYHSIGISFMNHYWTTMGVHRYLDASMGKMKYRFWRGEGIKC